MRGRGTRRGAVAIGVAGVVVGGAFGPPLAAVAADKLQEVVVANGTDRPVPTRPVGTTQVAGSVGLADGTEVALADGTKVGLTDGTKVLLDSPVRLADDASVKVDNTDADPVPVRVVGGDGGGAAAAAQTPWSFRSSVFGSVGSSIDFGPAYTVPEGKTLVITSGHGYAGSGVRRVALERRGCTGTGSGLYQYGELSGPPNGLVWTLHGESRATEGCQLVPQTSHDPETNGDASFHLYGYLIDG